MTVPAVTRDKYSAPFFDHAQRGVLVVPRCDRGHHQPLTRGFGGPVVRCHQCTSAIFAWSPVSGEASLVSWTVLHLRGGAAATRIVGVVELAEGPWLNGLVDVPDDAGLRAGLPMVIGFAATGDGEGEPVPVFRPKG